MEDWKPCGADALKTSATSTAEMAMAQSVQLDHSGVVSEAACFSLPSGVSDALESVAHCLGAAAPLRAFSMPSCFTAMSTVLASADDNSR